VCVCVCVCVCVRVCVCACVCACACVMTHSYKWHAYIYTHTFTHNMYNVQTGVRNCILPCIYIHTHTHACTVLISGFTASEAVYCCSVLQCVAVCCSWSRDSQYQRPCIVEKSCSVLQCVAVRCSVLQCVCRMRLGSRILTHSISSHMCVHVRI